MDLLKDPVLSKVCVRAEVVTGKEGKTKEEVKRIQK